MPYFRDPQASVDISVIVPLYNEEGNTPILFEKLKQVLTGMGKSFELLFVDDGSSDGTFALLRALSEKHPFLQVIRFSRNFGQTAALAAGIKAAVGKTIITIDGDLQNDPEDIPALVGKLEEGFDLVSGWRKDRQDLLWSRKVPSWCANRIISWFSGVSLHDYGCSLKAYRPKFLKNLSLYGEMHRFLPALIAREGGKVTEMVVRHHPRTVGVSKYGLERVIKVILDLFVLKFMAGYSTRPIHFFGFFGLLGLFIGAMFGFYTLYVRVIVGIPGVLLLPLVLLGMMFILLGGQSLFIGLLGEISMRIYYESQAKAPYVIDEILNGTSDPCADS